MADKTNRPRNDDVFWSKIGMNSSDEDAYIPGLSAPGNKRPGRVKARKTKEIHASVPLTQPIVEDAKREFSLSDKSIKGKLAKPTMSKTKQLAHSFQAKEKYRPTSVEDRPMSVKYRPTSVEDSGMSTTFESFAERSIRRLQKASLKDLRPEDKQRVANLIKELARVGEEKEKVVKELHGEREQYEHQLMTMVEQQEKILQEREDIQEKLFQCQKLLTEYQAQLLNKQEKLNTSIHDIQEEMDKTKSDTKQTRQVVSVVPEITAPRDNPRHRNPARVVEVFTNPARVIEVCSNPARVIEVCPPMYDLSEMDDRSLTPVLLNRIPSPIDRQDPPRVGRQSRPREPVSRQPANQNTLEDYLTNQHAADESVSDLLLNPIETVKRPFTSMIDKEIARERSLSRGSRTSDYSRSRSASPSEGRPKFAYPQKLSSMGPLHEPLASSTQKSMEIRAINFENESVRSRLSNKNLLTGSKGHLNSKPGHARGDSPADMDSVRSRVAFNGRDEYDDEVEKHSPNMKSPAKMFTDPAYAQFYKKLSPGGRKRELLKQRQALLDEQERLRVVLEKQERQLQTRKYEYDKRKELQEQRMEFYKQGGKFPALKLDFDNGSDKGSGVEEEEAMEKGSAKGLIEARRSPDIDMSSPRSNIEIDDEVKVVRSRVSMGTSPIATSPHSNKITIATSPVQSANMPGSETPRFIDVATSISYRTPLKDSSNHVQGNLPLASNRQRSSPFSKQSQIEEGQRAVRTPGEKTLNVIELVNSMEEEPPISSSRNHSYEDLENRPDRHFTPNKYITHGKGVAQSSPYRQYTSQVPQKTSRGKLLNDEEESLEENKILEDIFFL